MYVLKIKLFFFTGYILHTSVYSRFCIHLPVLTYIGVARIFDWGGGGGGKPQITCNGVIRNFQKRNFLWGKDIVEWKM